MKTTLFLLGPSDDDARNITNIEFADQERVAGNFNWSGWLPLWPFIQSDASLRAKSILGLVGIHSFNPPDNASLNLFNLVGDADASVASLREIRHIGERLNPAHYFNRPEQVARTTRERLPVTLAGIPGVRVPRVLALKASSFDEAAAQCEAFGRWPLIIRARGFHSGLNMHLLHEPGRLGDFKDAAWLLDQAILSEYVDYRHTGGLYRKVRIVMVDGVPYPRHAIVSNQPFIHSRNRADLMALEPALRRGEAQFLQWLAVEGLTAPPYATIFAAIHARIGLDIYGVDCALLGDEVLVFEANACMHFLDQDYGTSGEYAYLEPHVRTLRRAVKRLLMQA